MSNNKVGPLDIYDAIGIWMKDFSVTPEKVISVLKRSQKSRSCEKKRWYEKAGRGRTMAVMFQLSISNEYRLINGGF